MGQEEVKKALKRSGSWLLSNEIAKSTGSSLKSIQSSLRRLVKWGEVKKEPAKRVIKDSKRLKEKSFAGYAYKLKEFKTLDDYKFNGRTVLLRLDLNSSYNPLFTPSENFSNHLPTILELIEKQARIVLLTHQDNNESLKPHTSYLSQKLNQNVAYINDLIGKDAQEKIKNLKNGQVLLLKNLFSSEEETKTKLKKQKKTKLVKTLSSLADYYINDAFSLSHLTYTSMTGFPQLMTSLLGRYFEKELEMANHILKPSKPCLYILGGNKPNQLTSLIKISIEKNRADTILTSGFLSHLLHLAKGQKLGGQESDLKKSNFKISSEIKHLIKKDSIILPRDYVISTFGVKENIPLRHLPIYQSLSEVGSETLQHYLSMIKKVKTIFVKGPLGKIENPEFQESTKLLLREIAKSDAFTFILGSSTVDCFKNFNIPITKINHLSKNSEPLLRYLSEETLPALEFLKGK